MSEMDGICEQCLVDGLSPKTLVRIVATGIIHIGELSESAQIVVVAAADKL